MSPAGWDRLAVALQPIVDALADALRRPGSNARGVLSVIESVAMLVGARDARGLADLAQAGEQLVEDARERLPGKRRGTRRDLVVAAVRGAVRREADGHGWADRWRVLLAAEHVRFRIGPASEGAEALDHLEACGELEADDAGRVRLI